MALNRKDTNLLFQSRALVQEQARVSAATRSAGLRILISTNKPGSASGLSPATDTARATTIGRFKESNKWRFPHERRPPSLPLLFNFGKKSLFCQPLLVVLSNTTKVLRYFAPYEARADALRRQENLW